METKSLVEELREIADDHDSNVGCRLRCEFCSKKCEDYDSCSNCTGDALHVIADRIEREYIPLPRFEDGEPVKVGDLVLWNDGGAKRVEGIKVDVQLEGSCGTCNSVLKRCVDTLELIEADAMKTYDEYWGCHHVSCHDCPAMADGKKPHERYATNYSCVLAKTFDLLRRQRELLERGQE